MDILRDTLAGARAYTLLDTLGGVEAKVLVKILADPVAEVKAGHLASHWRIQCPRY